MSHIGVVVSSLPAPILNLPGKDTPRGGGGESETKKEFSQLRTNIMKDYGIDAKKVNLLTSVSSNERDYGTTLLDGLTTDFASAKFKPGRQFRSDYVPRKEAEIKNNYADSFMGDIIGFEAFTKSFSEQIGNFVSLVQKIDEIPQS